MRILRSLLILNLIFLAVLSFGGIPTVLIVKIVPADKAVDGDAQDTLVQYIAQEFSDDGRVFPIAWGLTDPYYRNAVDSGWFRNVEKPGMADADRVARRLKADYVLVATVARTGLTMHATAALFRGGKMVWQDPQRDPKMEAMAKRNRQAEERNARKHKVQLPPDEDQDDGTRHLTILGTGTEDAENDLRSLARTWAALLEAGPLSNLRPHPAAASLTPSASVPEPTVIVSPPPKPVANTQILGDVAKLEGKGQYSQAINMLRDAVDEAPMDAERREALINALEKSGRPLMAASEARHAAELMPERVQFHILAAQGFMAAGKADEATAQVKDAVAHNPDAPETRMLLGQLDLQKLQLDDAKAQFEFVVSKGPNAEAFFNLALTKTLLSDEDGATKDLVSAQKAGLSQDPSAVDLRYRTSISLLDQALADLGPSGRTLLEHAKAKPRDAGLAADCSASLAKVSAAIAFLGEIATPDAFRASHERRLLALKLLTQSFDDIQDYLKSQDDDTMGDATISLGEGLKDLDLAKESFRQEPAKG